MNVLPPFANAGGITPNRQPVTATAAARAPDSNNHSNQPIRAPSNHEQASGSGNGTGTGAGAEMGERGNSIGEHRNFPQYSQAALPHHYNQFNIYPTPSIGIQQIASWTSGSASSHHHHHQRPEAPFPAYNAPHLRSSPHGYTESALQSSSPITTRYDYSAHPHHGMGNNHDPTPSSFSPPSPYDPWPRRRESMPEIMGNGAGALHQFQPVRPVMGSHTDSTESDINSFVHPSSEILHHTPISAPHPPSTAWQGAFASYPNVQTATPASNSARSRGSTFGSRTTDDERAPFAYASTGRPNSSIDGAESRPVTADAVRAGSAKGDVTAKDFSKKPLLKKAVKVETSDEMMNIEHGMDDDTDEKIDHRKRKRNRTIRSCVPCHNHKRKCDRKRPCGRCTALGLTGTCVYEIDETRDMNDPEVAEADRLRRRIAELEQVIRELRQKTPARSQAIPASISTPAPSASSSQRAASDTTGLSPNQVVDDNKKRRVIVDRFARFKLDEAKNAENSAAAGSSGNITPGAASLNATSKQAAGTVGPSHSSQPMTANAPASTDYREEIYTSNLLPGEEMSSDKSGRKIFLGALTGKSMLRRLRELTESKGDGELLTVPEDVAFTGVFPDNAKTFPFTTIWSHENFSEEIIGLLPNMEQAELLWQAWEEEHSIYFHPFHM
ncbi:hypothetical protein IAU59_006720 [Kwoniella sp. CBS 9459]